MRSIIHRLISLITLLAVVAAPGVVRAQPLAPEAEAAAFRQLATGMPLGSRIKVETRDGRRLTATLMAATDEAVVVKRESRVPEPAVTIRYGDLARLRLDQRSGFTLGKAIGIGLAAGVGAILTMLAIAVSIGD